jgi:hemerythrin
MNKLLLSDNELQKDLEEAAQLVTRLKEDYPSHSKERRLLLLIKDASFFVYLHHKKAFSDFLRQANNGLTSNQLQKLKELGITIEDD